jgi:hypothetical protein
MCDCENQIITPLQWYDEVLKTMNIHPLARPPRENQAISTLLKS